MCMCICKLFGRLNCFCGKWCLLVTASILFILGIVLAGFWTGFFKKYLKHQLSVSNENTMAYKMWQETPIPMYLTFYLFNWTNADLMEKNPKLKPSFSEMGPYVFYEHHIRENVTFHDNNTLTYLNKRIWHYEREKSTGSLDDNITILNPIAIIVGNLVKDQHLLVRKAVNIFLEEKGETLSLRKSIRELLFDGYDDPLIKIAEKLNISGLKLPFDKFGWFYDRNNSATYDGVFNMYDGKNDLSKLGLIANWNYEHKTAYYPNNCGIVNGTSGELWYPPNNDEEIAIFSSDLCSNVKMHKNSTDSLLGIQGAVYVGKDDVFDNGTFYSSSKCFASGMPTGVRNVATCKFGAPAYMSFPHFYLADPIYTQNVIGMKPNRELHETKIILEPTIGLPLKVNAAFQLNLLMRNIEGIDIFSKVKTTLMPCFWFVQTAELTPELASQMRVVFIAQKVGTYTGYGFIGLGALFLIIFMVIIYKRGWKKADYEEAENVESSILVDC